jgi:hypothetical protein
VEQEQILVQIFQEYQTLEFMVEVAEAVMAQELLQIMDQEQEELVVAELVEEGQVELVLLELLIQVEVAEAVAK